jgi:hypothetical protein
LKHYSRENFIIHNFRKLREEVKETKLIALSSEKGKEDCRDEQVQTEEETMPGVTSNSPENAVTG